MAICAVGLWSHQPPSSLAGHIPLGEVFTSVLGLIRESRLPTLMWHSLISVRVGSIKMNALERSIQGQRIPVRQAEPHDGRSPAIGGPRGGRWTALQSAKVMTTDTHNQTSEAEKCILTRGWNLSTTDCPAHLEKSGLGCGHEESSLAIRSFKIHLVHAPKSWAGTDSNFLPGF